MSTQNHMAWFGVFVKDGDGDPIIICRLEQDADNYIEYPNEAYANKTLFKAPYSFQTLYPA